jgi:hypothetical protein
MTSAGKDLFKRHRRRKRILFSGNAYIKTQTKISIDPKGLLFAQYLQKQKSLKFVRSLVSVRYYSNLLSVQLMWKNEFIFN